MPTPSKPRAFFLHFNKPASRSAGRACWSVHQSGVCHIVHDFVLRATVRPHYRKTQPVCVLKGRGVVTVDGDTATIS